MRKKLKDRISDKLVNAFLKNKIISPIPGKFTKRLTEAYIIVVYKKKNTEVHICTKMSVIGNTQSL